MSSWAPKQFSKEELENILLIKIIGTKEDSFLDFTFRKKGTNLWITDGKWKPSYHKGKSFTDNNKRNIEQFDFFLNGVLSNDHYSPIITKLILLPEIDEQLEFDFKRR